MTLEVRRQISKGEKAQMDYVFDFDKLKVRVFGYAFTAMALAHSPLSDVRMP